MTGGEIGPSTTSRGGTSTAAEPIEIGIATAAEIGAILTLQRLCFRSEAALYDDWAIPPLTETAADLAAEHPTHRILVARHEGSIVGSVRGRLSGRSCNIGRLMVHPGYRCRGLGERLMRAIEACFPEAERFELFTGHLSETNLRLYRRLRYVETGRRVVSPRLQLVSLEKSVALR